MEEPQKEEFKKKNQKYSLKYKIHILDLLNKGISYHTIENKMNLEREMVRRWKANEEKLTIIKNKDIKYQKNRKGGI